VSAGARSACRRTSRQTDGAKPSRITLETLERLLNRFNSGALSSEDVAMIALEKVLIPTDFSEPSGVALVYGLEIARAFRATPILLHVVEDRFTRVVGDGVVVNTPELQEELETSVRRRLEMPISNEDRDRLNPQAVVIASSTPAYAIARYAKDAEVDLIVMGTHGRRAMAHLLIGSVAELVVRIAPCPVLTVRYPEHEFVRPDVLGVSR